MEISHHKDKRTYDDLRESSNLHDNGLRKIVPGIGLRASGNSNKLQKNVNELRRQILGNVGPVGV